MFLSMLAGDEAVTITSMALVKHLEVLIHTSGIQGREDITVLALIIHLNIKMIQFTLLMVFLIPTAC